MVSGFEAMVTTVIGQQVSLAAMRTFTGRLVARWGEPGPDGLAAFPSPGRLAAVPAEQLRQVIGLTEARARTLADVIALAASGFDPGPDDLSLTGPLGTLKGIGPWTLDYLRLRLLQDPDAFVPGDLVARRALGAVSPQEASALAEPWRPARGYALMQLWTAAAHLPGRSAGLR